MNKSVSAIIATALLAAQTHARLLASTTYADDNCCEFYSEHDQKGTKTKYCVQPGEGKKKINNVNVLSYRCGSRV